MRYSLYHNIQVGVMQMVLSDAVDMTHI